MHRAIALPSYAQNPAFVLFQSQPGGPQGIRQLGRRVAAEVADTGGAVINSPGQVQGINPALSRRLVAIVPVLTEKAVEGAALIEDGQILVAAFGSWRIGKLRIAVPGAAGTDPVGHAVGGQGIIIPADIAFYSSGPDKSVLPVESQPAVPPATIRNTALVYTEVAFQPILVPGRPLRQAEGSPGGSVRLLDQGKYPSEVPSKAVQAQPQGAGDER